MITEFFKIIQVMSNIFDHTNPLISALNILVFQTRNFCIFLPIFYLEIFAFGDIFNELFIKSLTPMIN